VPGSLPPASDPDLVERAQRAKAALGERVFVLGHHYQRDEVIRFADVTGDSFKLARNAAGRPQAHADTEQWAKVALDRMLALPGKSHRD